MAQSPLEQIVSSRVMGRDPSTSRGIQPPSVKDTSTPGWDVEGFNKAFNDARLAGQEDFRFNRQDGLGERSFHTRRADGKPLPNQSSNGDDPMETGAVNATAPAPASSQLPPELIQELMTGANVPAPPAMAAPGMPAPASNSPQVPRPVGNPTTPSVSAAPEKLQGSALFEQDLNAGSDLLGSLLGHASDIGNNVTNYVQPGSEPFSNPIPEQGGTKLLALIKQLIQGIAKPNPNQIGPGPQNGIADWVTEKFNRDSTAPSNDVYNNPGGNANGGDVNSALVSQIQQVLGKM